MEDDGTVDAALDMEGWYWPLDEDDDTVLDTVVVTDVVAGVDNVVVVVIVVVVIVAVDVAATGCVAVVGIGNAMLEAVVTADDVDVGAVLGPRLVDAPITCILLTLPLLLRILLADAKPLLLPLLAAVPLPRPIGSETGGNSGLTVLIDVPGVMGVAGVGCTQLCCTVARGSVFSADDMVAVNVNGDRDVLMPI